MRLEQLGFIKNELLLFPQSFGKSQILNCGCLLCKELQFCSLVLEFGASVEPPALGRCGEGMDLVP